MGHPVRSRRHLFKGYTTDSVCPTLVGVIQSLGAAPFRDDISIRYPGERDYAKYSKIAEGSEVKNIEVIAGGNKARKIDEADRLEDEYGVPASHWTKQKGFGLVEKDDTGEIVEHDLHWYHSLETGRVEMKAIWELL
jgi:hypothetical protein